ncbi:MAG: hypothetical protein QXM68_04265 [Candidatus Aenigmatarchaeota archaeon]|nr:hypothetical protein [Candidatus Aenigmarchaeota archaeon]
MEFKKFRIIALKDPYQGYTLVGDGAPEPKAFKSYDELLNYVDTLCEKAKEKVLF